MNKKHIYLILIIISVLSILFIFIKSKNKNEITVSNEIFQQKLDLINHFEGSDVKFINNINESEFNFPKTLPYIEQSKVTISNQLIKNISLNLGFTSEPLEIEDVEKGKLLIWNGDKMNLIITPKIGHVQYTPNETYINLSKNSINKNLSDSEYKAVAEDFLINKIGLQKSELNLLNFTYYKVSGGNEENLTKGSKENYDILQLNYSENSGSFPIFTLDPDQSQIYIQFTKDGNVINLNGNIGYKFTKSINEYPVKNFEEFSLSLQNSIIVSIDDNNTNLPDIHTSDLKDVTANNVSIVFLFEESSKTLIQPVFLIQGKVTLKNKKVNAVFYLPAFKEFSQP